MPLDLIPKDRELREVFELLGVIGLLAYLGRLAWHLQQVKAKRRNFWSLALLWEIPLALFCGIVAAGLGEYLGLSGYTAAGFISLIAYLGPGGIEAMFERALKNWINGPPKG